MRSTLINKEEKAREIKYPCLMTGSTSLGTIIVLFHAEDCGTVVHSERKGQPVGYYSEAWAMSSFTPFDGTIQLTND